MGVHKGLDQARQNAFVTVPEATFMNVDRNGIPIYRSDVGSDGNGLTNPQNWVEQVADGRFLTESTALVGEEGVITRSFMPRYILMEPHLRGVCGLPFSDTQIDGGTRRKVIWNDPEDASPAIETHTGYYGRSDLATRLLGGKVQAWNIDVKRGADGGTVSGNITNHYNAYQPGCSIPGASAHAGKLRVGKNGATTGLQLRVAVNTGGVAVGESHNLVGTNVNGNATPYIGAPAYVPGTTPADYQAALRASNVPYLANVVVTGDTIAQAGNGTLNFAFPTGAGNVPDIKPGAGVGWQGYVQTPYSSGGWSSTIVQLTAGMTAAQIVTAMQTGTGLTAVAVTNRDGVNPYNPATDNDYLITVVTPATTKVQFERVTGPKWAIRQLALGGDGTELTYPESPFLLSSHWRVYLAKNEDDLSRINLDDLPDESGNGGDPHLLSEAVGFNFSMADLVKGHYTGNTNLSATDFVGGARTVALSLMLPNNEKPGSDCDYMYRTQEGCAATGFWLKRVFSCGGWAYWEDIYCGRRETAAQSVDNEVYMKNFPLVRRRNPERTGSLRFGLILPN